MKLKKKMKLFNKIQKVQKMSNYFNNQNLVTPRLILPLTKKCHFLKEANNQLN